MSRKFIHCLANPLGSDDVGARDFWISLSCEHLDPIPGIDGLYAIGDGMNDTSGYVMTFGYFHVGAMGGAR